MAGEQFLGAFGNVLQVNPDSGGYGVILLLALILLVLSFVFWKGADGIRRMLGELRGIFPFTNSGSTREARLNYVVCRYCGKGMGVLNPVYTTYENVPHIEGYCNHCRRFIRSRLKG